MYAVIKTGGKQYRVQEGDILRVEKLDAAPGDKISFDEVLMIGEGDKLKVGADVAKARVPAVVTENGKGRKVVIFKKHRRKNYRLTKGHRQAYTAVRIGRIAAPRKAAARKAVEAEKE